MGTLNILNVGAGDTKITFDKNNPAEAIRAGRIIRDMLRRGYALLIEVERDGQKAFERAIDFNEATSEYIIADFDPSASAGHDPKPKVRPEAKSGASETEAAAPAASTRVTGKRGTYRRRVPAAGTTAVAAGRSAGG